MGRHTRAGLAMNLVGSVSNQCTGGAGGGIRVKASQANLVGWFRVERGDNGQTVESTRPSLR